jgi:hypothetical protein
VIVSIVSWSVFLPELLRSSGEITGCNKLYTSFVGKDLVVSRKKPVRAQLFQRDWRLIIPGKLIYFV